MNGLLNTVHGVLLIAVFWQGCSGGSKAKYVTVINQPSGLELTSRYVTGDKSVRVRRHDGPAVVDFYMPDTLPRVSSKRIAASVKQFDFKYVEKYSIEEWMKVFAKETSSECPSNGLQFDAVSPTKAILHVTADQTTDGMVNFFVRDTINAPIVQMVVHQPRGTTKDKRICVTTWNTGFMTTLAAELSDMRDQLVVELSKDSGFNGDMIGTRLRRRLPDGPKEGPPG